MIEEIKWHEGNSPDESGYYLACWKHRGDGRSLRVSEFWFDGENWQTGRNYINIGDNIYAQESHLYVTHLVISWAKKPTYTRKINK